MSSSTIQIARHFWNTVGADNVFPRDIGGAVSLALPIDIIYLPELNLKQIGTWLSQRKIPIEKISMGFDVNDRFIHGFILAWRGTGSIFINAMDSEEERRYTIAHEASHFLLDHHIPRERAKKRFGESILKVIDGTRPATDEERIDSALSSVEIKLSTHLLAKDGDGTFDDLEVLNSENDVDSLALELLAPSSQVIQDANPKKSKISFHNFKNQCYHVLRTTYLIPDSVANAYATRLAYKTAGPPSLMSELGF